jgi:superfamily I DNA/RNA helicase
MHSFATSILMKNQDALPTKLPLRIPSDFEIAEIIYPYIAAKSNLRKTRVKKLVHHMASMWESLTEEDAPDFTPEERSRFNSAFQSATRLFGFTLLSQLPDLLRKMLAEQSEIKGIDLNLLIVDEYQDLNKCEVELLSLLNKRGTPVLAVGDEDQSIYSFRRAHPAGIREFEQTFSDSEVYDLSICHRCPQNLIDWAQHVIQGDLARTTRPVPQSTSSEQAKTYLLHFASESSEAKGVAKMIEYLIQKKEFSADDILILTRTDSNERFTKAIKEELATKNISTSDPKFYKKILEKEETINLFALLRLLHNKEDSLAWITLATNKTGLGKTKINSLVRKSEGENVSFAKTIWSEIKESYPTVNSLPFKELTRSVQTILTTYEAQKAEDGTHWGQWIIDNSTQVLGMNISEELQAILLEVDKRIDGEKPSLGFYVSQIVPILKDIANEKQTGVRFMTMQGSKGLTARITFVVGVDNDLIPRPEQDTAEERRLLYVAMTRSQEILIMTWANRRMGPQARSGRSNVNRRNYSDFLQNGPIQSKDGDALVKKLG